MIRRTVLLGALLLIASHALGHTKLADSTPAADTTVERPPQNLVLEFNEPVRLTVVTLTDPAGDAKPLSPLPAEAAARFVLEVREPLGPGRYLIAWRAVGADTHIVSGEIPFRIAATTQ